MIIQRFDYTGDNAVAAAGVMAELAAASAWLGGSEGALPGAGTE